MSSLYSTSLKIELIGTGDQTGVWGGTTNTNLGTAIEQAIVGKSSLVTGDFTANVATLTLTDTNASQTARAFVLDVTATLSAAGTINVPAVQKPYIVFNNTVGGFALTVKVSGLTGVSIPNGRKAIIYNNGTDVEDAITYLSSLTLGSPLPLTSGGTGGLLTTTYGGTGLASFTAGDLPYYATGTALSKLGIGTNNYVLASNGTAPTWVNPSSVTTGIATNIAGGATGSVPYQSAASTTGFLAIGAANTVLTSSGTAPQYVAQSTLAVGTATNIAGGAANQLVVQSGSGATTFATAPTTVGYVLGWNGSALTWVAAPAAVSAIDLVGGSAGVVPYQSATNTTLFTAVGTAGQVLTSSGAGAPTWSSAIAATSLSYTTTLTGGTGIVNLGSGQFYKDASGNVGIGVTPSAWNSSYKAMQFGSTGVLYSTSNAGFGNNIFVNSGGTSTYITTASAQLYLQNSGAHVWYNAPSGTAGNPITFTQAMTLDASGNLGVGKTPVAGRGVLQANGDVEMTSQNTGQLAGLRNRIINGAMTIDQRNAGAAVTPSGIGGTPTYSVDRFGYFASVASKLTFQQVADAPTGFKNSLKITVATQYAPLAADYFGLYHPIEGFNCIDLALGTASASAICVSLWVKGSVAGTYSVALLNSAGSRSYVGTVSVTTSWVKQTVTLTGDTSGTWLTDSGVGLSLRFDFGSGSNLNATAGSWQAGTFLRTSGSVTFVNQTAGATLNITGVQLEIGSVATPFEQRPIGMELALCQRYYYKIANTSANRYYSGSVSAASTTRIISSVFTVASQLRVSPTITYSGIDIYNSSYSSVGAITSASVYAGGTSQTPSLDINLASGLTTGSQYIVTIAPTTGYMDFSAEL